MLSMPICGENVAEFVLSQQLTPACCGMRVPNPDGQRAVGLLGIGNARPRHGPSSRRSGAVASSMFLTVTWLIATPALCIAAAISRSDRPRPFNRRIRRITACCLGTATNPPLASSHRQPNGALPLHAILALPRRGQRQTAQWVVVEAKSTSPPLAPSCLRRPATNCPPVMEFRQAMAGLQAHMVFGMSRRILNFRLLCL
jgi:hypothetical protein